MPDFRLTVTEPGGSPAIATRLWTDPASGSRPSRITSFNDRQHRFLRAAPGDIVELRAIMNGEVAPEDDTVVGLFTSWAIEYPTAGHPLKTFPSPGFSSIVQFTLSDIGHYLLAMRHEDTGGAPKSAAGGVIIVHIDVTQN